MTLAPTLAVFALLSQAAPEQPRASISGRISSAQTDEGIGGVMVQLTWNGLGGTEIATSTAPDGTFSFPSLRAGRYILSARKAGHQPAQRLPIMIDLHKDQSHTGIGIRFYRPGVIAGRVKDSDGFPVIEAEITAFRFLWADGRRKIVAAGSSTSDDRGEYRISGLPAGEYLVAATPVPLQTGSGNGTPGLVRTYYPSAAHASDSPALHLQWSQELPDINFELHPQPVFCVAGRVIQAETGGTCTSCALRLSSLEKGYNVPRGTTQVGQEGGYGFCGLTSGTYSVSAVDVATSGAGIGLRTVTVARSDLRRADLLLGVEHTIAGRLILDSPDKEVTKDFQIHFRPDEAPAAASAATIRDDRSFEVSGLSSGKYTIALENAPAGGYLKELRLGGQALLSPQVDIPEDGPPGELEVVVGFDSAILMVDVKPEGNGDSNTLVVLFPAEGSSAYAGERQGRSGPEGKITFMQLPPGTYNVYAFKESSASEWEAFATRQRYSDHGRTVVLGPGKKETVEISLLPD